MEERDLESQRDTSITATGYLVLEVEIQRIRNIIMTRPVSLAIRAIMTYNLRNELWDTSRDPSDSETNRQ